MSAKANYTEYFASMVDLNKIYSNYGAILTKTDADGHLAKIYDCFTTVFRDEIRFAIQGDITRVKKT